MPQTGRTAEPPTKHSNQQNTTHHAGCVSAILRKISDCVIRTRGVSRHSVDDHVDSLIVQQIPHPKPEVIVFGPRQPYSGRTSEVGLTCCA